MDDELADIVRALVGKRQATVAAAVPAVLFALAG
jgi:hypothetical protein